MAYPDLADIRYRVRTILNETTAALWTDNILNRAINDGQRDLAIKGSCIINVDSLTTTASTRFVQFMGYMVKAVEYLPSTGTKRGLPRITPHMVGHLPTSGSIPRYWYQWGKQIGIEPVPDASYNLSVTIIDFPTTELSSDTDEPEIPAAYNNLLTIYAAYRALMRPSKYGTSGILYREYLSALNSIKKQYSDTIPDGYSEFLIPPQTIQRGIS